MENLKYPAYPLPIISDSKDQIFDTTDYGKHNGGLTKIELASLMIAQGLCADPAMDSTNVIPELAVKIAKAVLEEANK